MSERNYKHDNKNSSLGSPEGAMAEALKAAGFKPAKTTSVKSDERETLIASTNHGNPVTCSEKELFLMACEGVEPLKTNNTMQPETRTNAARRSGTKSPEHATSVEETKLHLLPREKHQRKSASKSVSLKGPDLPKSSAQKNSRISNLNNKKGRSRYRVRAPSLIATSSRAASDVPKVIEQILPDGSRKIYIPGVYIQNSLAKKPSKNSSSKIENTDLRIKGSVAVQQSVLETAENHFLSAPLNPAQMMNVGSGIDEIELVIGLDFGTTFCKVVLREAASGRAWAIPFSTDSINPYLLCTTVWKNNKDFSLMRTGVSIGNLKMALFSNHSSLADELGAAAFIGLVISHVKTWFWQYKAMEFPKSDVLWVAHMGLPASDLQNTNLVEKFRRVLWAGMLLSERIHGSVDENDVRLCLSEVQKATQGNRDTASVSEWGSIHREQIEIFPEIAAQIYGYLKSDLRDPNQQVFMLVDVGGGTVDAALFRVFDADQDQTQFVFWGTAVAALGVYVLHRERLAWHVEQLKRIGRTAIAMQLQRILDKKFVPSVVPGMIHEYLIGADYPSVTCDNDFSNNFAKLLWDDVVLAARNRVGDFADGNTRVGFLLCGGGRTIALYEKFLQQINSPSSSTRLRLYPVEIGRPSRLEPRNIRNTEYHRLSVAYGLSFNDIGAIVTPDKLIPRSPMRNPDISNSFVHKEYT